MDDETYVSWEGEVRLTGGGRVNLVGRVRFCDGFGFGFGFGFGLDRERGAVVRSKLLAAGGAVRARAARWNWRKRWEVLKKIMMFAWGGPFFFFFFLARTMECMRWLSFSFLKFLPVACTSGCNNSVSSIFIRAE